MYVLNKIRGLEDRGISIYTKSRKPNVDLCVLVSKIEFLKTAVLLTTSSYFVHALERVKVDTAQTAATGQVKLVQ